MEIDKPKKDPHVLVGAKGVRLKKFEQILSKLLQNRQVKPLCVYMQLPRLVPTRSRCSSKITNTAAAAIHEDDSGNRENENWPFDQLPAAARVHGILEGQLSDMKKARRKENQLRSMFRCIFALLRITSDKNVKTNNGGDSSSSSSSSSTDAVKGRVASDSSRPFTIVDFGGGSGHLAIPLALLLPHIRVIVVDLNERSLQLLHQKANECDRCNHTEQEELDETSKYQKQHHRSQQHGGEKIASEGNLDHPELSSFSSPSKTRPCQNIPNLHTFHGSLQSFDEKFDMAVALHLCGEATDVALRKAGQVQADAVVFAPCCVGKLNRTKKNPYIYQATGANTPEVCYPQSNMFSPLFSQQEEWNALAKAADYSDLDECRTSRNAARRTAKAFLETDRRLFLEETYNYQTALTRMDPWESTPKNDILLAWKKRSGSSSHNQDDTSVQLFLPDDDCQADIQLTIDHLLEPHTSFKVTKQLNNKKDNTRVDWTLEEEQSIRQKLHSFLENSCEDSVMVFPTGMGGRKRKLIHFVAEQMKLVHWCEGKKSAAKTVAVARRGRKRKQQDIVDGTNVNR